MDTHPRDEDLLETGRPPLRRRTRIALTAGAIVAAVAVAVVLWVDRVDADRDDAAPALSTGPTAVSTVPSARGPVSSPPKPPCLDVGGSRLNCGVTPTLSAPVLRALQTVLPGAAVEVASTVVGRDGRVYSRRATVRATTGATLQVAIGPPNGQYSVITVPSSVVPTLIRFDVDSDVDARDHHVTVTFQAGGSGRPPSVAALRRLAADPRLFTV